MFYGKYKFLCRLKDDANLPYYKGSTFRGVFGRALKRVVCALFHLYLWADGKDRDRKNISGKREKIEIVYWFRLLIWFVMAFISCNSLMNIAI